LCRRIERGAPRFLCDHFPYAIVHRDTPGRVIVVAIMHLKRQPFYWRHRID
jgi:hypothetical protein